VIIDDDGDESTSTTTNDHGRSRPTHLFSQTPRTRVTMQDRSSHHQAPSREAEIRQLKRLHKQNLLELRNIEIEKRLEHLGGLGGQDELGGSFMMNGLP
jgi:hypothetical protein